MLCVVVSLKETTNLFRRGNSEQETAKDSKAGLKSKFQNFNAKVNQNVDIRQMDIVRQTDRQHQSIGRNYLAIKPKIILKASMVSCVYIIVVFKARQNFSSINLYTCIYSETRLLWIPRDLRFYFPISVLLTMHITNFNVMIGKLHTICVAKEIDR